MLYVLLNCNFRLLSAQFGRQDRDTFKVVDNEQKSKFQLENPFLG